MRQLRPLLARRRALTLILGAVVAPPLSGCTHSSGRKAERESSPSTSARDEDLARARLLSAAVAREQAMLDLCTVAAGGHRARGVLTAAVRDHRAHLEALRSVRSSAGAGPIPTPSVSAPATDSPGDDASPTAAPPAPPVVADAESAWSRDLLTLLPEAPPDLRRLFASVAAAEASHAALLNGAT